MSQQKSGRNGAGRQKKSKGLLTAMGELEREHAALVQMELVLVWLGDMEHLHITVLHPHCKPLSSRAVAQRKDLE